MVTLGSGNLDMFDLFSSVGVLCKILGDLLI